MKINYNSRLWSKEKGLCGCPQRTNWQFEYAGTKYYIPAVYRFSKGIVFDVINILDETKLRDFIKKYETIEETLTPLQRRCIVQNHPYKTVPIREIWINGKQVEGQYSASSSLSIPWVKENDENKLEHVRKAYAYILKDTVCFSCERFCVPYPTANSKFQKLLRFLRLDRVKEIKLSTYPVDRFFPLNIHFDISVVEKQKKIYFIHPLTGIKHTLYFKSTESMKIPFKLRGKRTLHIIQSMYEIYPALPQGDTLQFDSSIQYNETADDKFSPDSASSIGIIGGADGPTSIFYSSSREEKKVPYGLHGLPLHSCFSVPGIQNEESTYFVLEGINIKEYDEKEYNFY